MNRAFYSRRHFERLSNGAPDSPELAAERVAHRAAGERANREMMARFAPLTAENAEAAMKWQAERIQELGGRE